MESIGQIVKTRRTERGLTLPEAHEATKITMQNLAAIEEDRFDAFPNRVYARAFLRDYANYLSLDSATLLQRYEQDWGSATPAPAPKKKSRVLAITLGVVILLVAVAAAGVLYTKYMPLPPKPVRAEPSAPKPAPAPKPTPAPTSSTTASTGSASTTTTTASTGTTQPAPPKPPSAPGATVLPDKVTVQLKALGQSWVSIKVDGDKSIQKTLKQGEQATFVGKRVQVFTGNAGGLDVTVDGKSQGKLGPSGQIAKKVFTK